MAKLITKGLLGGLLQLALFAVALVVPAGLVPGGTWHWSRGLAFLGLYGVALEASIVILAVAAPASLAARLRRPAPRQQPRADRLATLFLVLATLGWLAFVPIDVFHLRLLPAPSPGVSLGDAALSLAGFVLIVGAIHQNSFAIPTVEDQSARGQVLVDTGLYAHIRHPMYAGILLFHAGLALWLGSTASLLTLLVILLALFIRVVVEEATLRRTLRDYGAYTARVPYRLIPRVW